MAMIMAKEDFEELVAVALDTIPAELADLIDNCVVLVEDYPPPDVLPDTLGLYTGTPLTERAGSTPGCRTRCRSFASPFWPSARRHDDVVEEVRITVVHEIAHHFGIDDERLHELGYG